MRKSFAEIRAEIEPPAWGMALVLLSVTGFLVGLWVLMAFVRILMG